MIVIPMAGLSRRFYDAGYRLPKYMLTVSDEPVFVHAVRSFERYFPDTPFLFVTRDVAGSERFVQQQCEKLGIATAKIHVLSHETIGQAETVALGLEASQVSDHEPITIFNIDTFRPEFRFPKLITDFPSDGFVEVFDGSGSNWSYVRPAEGDEPRVLETAEKRQISNLCCTGLYHFSRSGDFRAALEVERAAPAAAELYVAPLYNHLIANGKVIHYSKVPAADIAFCGVPKEYEMLIAAEPPTLQRNSDSLY